MRLKSYTTRQFRDCYAGLPENIKLTARKNYRIWQKNHLHPSLHYKQVHNTRPIFFARVGLSYRVLGIENNGSMIWFWIGSHNEYDRLLNQM